jgi:hypothetical protein
LVVVGDLMRDEEARERSAIGETRIGKSRLIRALPRHLASYTTQSDITERQPRNTARACCVIPGGCPTFGSPPDLLEQMVGAQGLEPWTR